MSLTDENTSSEMDLPRRAAPQLEILAVPRRVRAMFAGHVVADSDYVVVLRRHGLPDQRFFPRDDVETGYLGETRDTVHDPDLGEGRCFTWVMEGDIVERAACAFENPPQAAESLAGLLCLSEAVFEIYELTESDLAAAPRATHAHGSTA
jgi:uncharacterized protein (DUF427 family)